MTFSFSKVRFYLSCGPANNTARPAMRIFWPEGKTHRSGSFGSFENSVQVETEPDGVRFDPDTVSAERIAEAADYEGVRVNLKAYLERAKIPIQIDIGFGDAVTPPPVENNYPTLLGSTAPRLLTYPRETVVAEKLEAMVKLGIANSRMKDFYDMEVLSRTFSFSGKSLREAIHNTFERRGTELPLDGTPLAFTIDFYEDVNKIRQWIAFSEKNRSYIEPIEFKTLVAHIAKFLVPVTSAARRNASFTKTWKAGGPWS
jgi:Nucleotidyl transferase AbiEii toxin, Type IV TA system